MNHPLIGHGSDGDRERGLAADQHGRGIAGGDPAEHPRGEEHRVQSGAVRGHGDLGLAAAGHEVTYVGRQDSLGGFFRIAHAQQGPGHLRERPPIRRAGPIRHAASCPRRHP